MKTTTLAALAVGLSLAGAPAIAQDYGQHRNRDNQPAADQQDQNDQEHRDRDRRGNKGDKDRTAPSGMHKSDWQNDNNRGDNDGNRDRRRGNRDNVNNNDDNNNNSNVRDRDRRFDNFGSDRRVKRDWAKFRRAFKSERRFRIGRYHAPRNFHYRRWHYGERLPIAFYARDYWLLDFIAYGLFAPPAGTVWVRYGDDALLIDTYTGEIIQVRYDVFYS